MGRIVQLCFTSLKRTGCCPADPLYHYSEPAVLDAHAGSISNPHLTRCEMPCIPLIAIGANFSLIGVVYITSNYAIS
jgi:hypothetical protein